MRYGTLIVGVSLLGGVAAMAAGCSGTDAPSSTGQVDQDFYAARQVKWPSNVIDVCFDGPVTPNPASMDIVKWWATSAWEANSQVTFNGWGMCGTDGSPADGIRVVFQDTWPHTIGLGQQIAGRPAGLVLNDTYSLFPVYTGVPKSVALQWNVVHEFGHALGFAHEQDWPDALSSAVPGALVPFDGTTELQCIQNYQNKQAAASWYDIEPYPYPIPSPMPTGPLSPIGFYDHVGVMNYCNTMNRIMNWGVLSLEDMTGVQKVYGAPLGTRGINDGSDPVAHQFPQSTVNLITAGNLHPSCTGIVLSTSKTTTKILTAAHCQVNSTTTVQFFPTTDGTGAAPSGTVLNASATTPVAVPGTPAIVCNQDAGGYPDSCVAHYADGTSTYADMAVLTVDAPVPAGYVAAPLAEKGFLAKTPEAPLAWEIGTGWGGSMQWTPIQLDSPSDAGGFVVLTAPFQMEGDSGGPVFRYADSTVTSANGLVLLALASQIGSCARWTQSCDSHETTYTSLTYGGNYDWLVAQGGAPATPAATSSAAIATFGAAE